MNDFNQKILCNVEDCMYCDCEFDTCVLNNICIGTYKHKTRCCKENTFCNNYIKKKIRDK